MSHYHRPQEPGVSDLVLLTSLSEKAITDNLHQRLSHECIYTYISNVLVSCNPFKRIPLYTEAMVELYQTHNRNELPPHIFALAEETYRSMVQEEENQCIIISGESGAGKTEASKQVVQYITAVSGNSPEMQKVKCIMLESNPLLEAFGNAKTVRNDNSSRFGKFFEMYFDRFGGPTGGHISNFLLEKSRVVYQQRGERNYHIFYQLCAGAPQSYRERYRIRTAAEFKYLTCGQTLTRDGVSDEKEWQETAEALNAIGMSEEEQENLVRLLAGILHIGEISFVPDGDVCRVENMDQLQFVCRLLKLDATNMTQALTHKRVNVNNEDIFSLLTIEQCRSMRDALAKAVYAAIFDWIVKRVNMAFTVAEEKKQLMIGVLDIYGFEVFERNSFEQFCINYVNEKLQQIFIQLTLKVEQEEYVKEKIAWTPIKFFNNQIVCDLCEAKTPTGIFPVLDDVCATMAKEAGSTVDLKLLDKLDTFCSSNPHFQRYETGFQVRHYAGDVNYTILGFVEKNRDAIGADLSALLQSCDDPFLTELMSPTLGSVTSGPGSPLRKGLASSTAGFKIKSQAADLVKTLMTCTPHYIRCIKPNDTRTALGFVEQRVMHQVKYLGLLENVKVRRAGFAYRQYFDKFLRRFKYLSPQTFPRPFKGSDKDGCLAILESVPELRGTQYYQLGETKVFLRYPENLFLLEAMREGAFSRVASSIQRAWRRFAARRTFIKLRRMAQKQFLNAGKERRRQSMLQTYEGDYVGYHGHAGLRGIVEYQDPAATAWVEYAAEAYGGRKYFFNPFTQETVWDVAPKVAKPVVKFCCTVQRITNHSTGQSATEFFVLTDQHVHLIEEHFPPPPAPPKPKARPKPLPRGKRAPETVPEPPPPPPAPPVPQYILRKKADLVLLHGISLSTLADHYTVLHFYDMGQQSTPAPTIPVDAGTVKKKGAKAKPSAPPAPTRKPNEPTDVLDDLILCTEHRTELVMIVQKVYRKLMGTKPEVTFSNAVSYLSKTDHPKAAAVPKSITFEMDWTLDDPMLYCCGPSSLLVRAPQGLSRELVQQLELNKEARRVAAQERFRREQQEQRQREAEREQEREQERQRLRELRKQEKALQEERERQEQEERARIIEERKERSRRVVEAHASKSVDDASDIFAQMRVKLRALHQ